VPIRVFVVGLVDGNFCSWFEIYGFNISYAGMAYSTGEIHGRMAFLGQTVRSRPGRTSHTLFRLKTRLVAISTFHHLECIKLLVHLVASEFGAVLVFLSLFLLLQETLPYSLVIGPS
jgi:hypothetical protein